MFYLLIGFVVAWLALAALKAFAQASPAALARLIKRSGGAAALALAAILMLRGAVSVAVGFAGLGFWLLSMGRGGPWAMFSWPARASGGTAFRGAAGRQGRASRVRSAMIEMELDHETGRMRGRILAGPYEGKELDSLTRPQCERLYELCRRDDPDGARLLHSYLDRRFSGWRAAGEAESDAGAGETSRRAGAMSKDEAYEVLGLKKGATREEVVRSHRSLMKKLHPDHGGTTDLAARVNEAKEVLMRRHS